MAFIPTVVWIVNVFFEEFSLRDPLTSGVGRLCFQIPWAAPDVTPDTVVHWPAFRSNRRRDCFGDYSRDIYARRILKPDCLLEDMRVGLRIMPDNEFRNRLVQFLE